jgi:hypothetical protein
VKSPQARREDPARRRSHTKPATGGHRRCPGQAGWVSPPACPSRHLDPVRAARRRCAQVRRPVTVRRYAATSWNVTRRPHQPPGSAASQVPRPYSAVAPGSRRCHSGRLPCRAGATPFRPGRIRQGPSMYEMEGPCPASPHQLASCLAWPIPRAARRGQVPARGPVSRLLPRSRGRPQVVPVSSGKTFLLHKRAPRKICRQPFRGIPRSTKRSTESGQLSRTSRQLFTGLFTVYAQPGDMNRRTPGPLSPDVRPIVHIGWRIIARATGFDGPQMA